jgi:membrane-bound lytic murein transglycosylase D
MAQAQSFLGPLLALVLLGPGAAGRAAAAEPPKKAPPPATGAAEPKKAPPAAAKKPASAPPAKVGSIPEAPAKAAPSPAAAPRPGSIPAAAAPEPAPALKPPDQRSAQGARKVEPAPAPPSPAAAVTPAPAPAVAKKGKATGKPQASLPPGAPQKPVDTATRRQIAGGLTDEDLRAGKDDPELSKLREAERVLFPRPLPGVSAGWSWDLPQASAPETEVSTSGLPPELAGRPAAPVARDADWLRGLTLPNLPLRYDERVVKYLKFYRDSQSGRAIARVWAKKSGRYQAALRSSLARAGLPTDLVWLSLIESGHNPAIVSPAGAVGLWQFMPDTGRTYGLTVDRWVDERLDPERSTDAAVRYLSDLYRRFGSWDLAMAAYNMGHGGLARAVKKFNTNDFWELARHEAGIPWETSLYVPKILATSILMNNKKSFGIDGIEPDPAESFGVVEVGPGLALSELAGSLGVDPVALERLNPAYLAGRTPPVAPGRVSPTYRVRVPASAKAGRVLLTSERESVVSYVVRRGDTPASIARASSTSEAALRSLNRMGTQEVLAAGTVVLVPRGVAADPGPREDDVVVIARDVEPPADSVRVFYPVLSGDTLSSVAANFGVARSDLLAWNAVDGGARLQDGMVLQIFPKQSHDLSRLRVLKQGAVRVLLVGSPGFFDYFEGLNGRRRLIVSAKAGDTLASIGKRYDMSVGWMERINRRSRSDRLGAGETVVVYADRSKHQQPVLTPSTVPLPPAVVAGSVASLESSKARPPAARSGVREPPARATP